MKKQKIMILLLIVLISAFLCSTIFSFARYVSNSITDYYLKSKGFYFYSDYLSTSSVSNMNNNWTGESISFNIKNSLNDGIATLDDINYTASCEIEGEPKDYATCYMNGTNTSSFTGTLTASKTCINDTGDNVDVSSFTKSECEIKGYRYISETVKKDLYFDIVLTDSNYTLKDIKVNINVTSNSPYHKTLIGSFLLHKVDSNTIFTKSDDYKEYNRLSFYNTASISKCIQINFDTNKFLVEKDKTSIYEYTEDENGYINSLKLIIGSNSNISLIFYKKNFDVTYSIDDFSISTDCEL